MKKLILLLIAILSAAVGQAAPTLSLSDIYYSEVYRRWVVEISLHNPDDEVSAFQCDIAVPSGFAFDAGNYAFTERAQITEGIKPIDTHSCAAAVRENGCLRVVVYSATLTPFKGIDGTVLIQALKDVSPNQSLTNSQKDKRFKGNLTNIVLSHVDESGEEKQPFYAEAVVGDSTLQCYNCMDDHAFIIGQVSEKELTEINRNLNTNDRLVTVDLTRCTQEQLGTLNVLNENAVILAATEYQVGNPSNVFWLEDEQWVCNAFSLHDDGLSFSLPVNARARSFSYDRAYHGGIWSTVCLPVSLTEEQYAQLTASNVSVRRLSAFNEATAEVSFTNIESFEANQPYVIHPKADGIVFNSLTNVQLVSASAQSVQVDNLTMVGNYDYTLIGSTSSITRYAYEEGSGEFVRLGNDCILKPFRALMELPQADAANKPRLFLAEPEETAISSIPTAPNEPTTVYSLDGLQQHRPLNKLPRGIYIVNGKKRVVK